MFTDIVVLWILTQLHAPSWCFVLIVVNLICKIISIICEIISAVAVHIARAENQ